MKTTTAILLGLAIIIVTGGCSGDGFKKTKSGILYRIISSDKKNPVAKPGEFLKVHFTQKVRDSIITTSVGALPTYARVDSVGAVYSPLEVFSKLRKGDSSIIVMLADSLQKKGQLPPYIRKNDKLTLIIKVVDVFKSEQEVVADQKAGMDNIKKNEVEVIQKYLDSSNIKAQKTDKGVFVVIERPGEAPLADSGKVAKVNYVGTTFKGVVFDTNTDSAFGHAQPYSFTVGQRGAIEGWDDGIRLFGKGGKGKLYIPSTLAYGANVPPGAKFKAYENLIFDIEVLDVSMPEKRNPGLPTLDPRSRARQKPDSSKAGR